MWRWQRWFCVCVYVCESTFIRNFTVNQAPAENATEIKHCSLSGVAFSGKIVDTAMLQVVGYLSAKSRVSFSFRCIFHRPTFCPTALHPPFPTIPNIFRSCILRPHFCQVLSQREVIPISSSCIMMWLTIQVIASFTTLIMSRTEMKTLIVHGPF